MIPVFGMPFFSNNSWHRKVESVEYRFSTKSGKCTLYFRIFHKNEKNWKKIRLIHKFEQIRPFRMNLEIIKIRMNMEKWHFRMNQVVRNYERVKIVFFTNKKGIRMILEKHSNESWKNVRLFLGFGFRIFHSTPS